MEKAEYSLWYQWAKEHMDVKKIAEHYIQYQEITKDSIGCIQKEENAWNDSVYHLLDQGLEFDEIEEQLYLYGNAIQEIYLELGLKIGARLGVETLC